MRAHGFLRFGPFQLDAVSGQLFLNGERVALPDSQAAILKYLATHPGEVASKDALMEAAWGGTNVEPNSLNRAISRLRKTLGGEREDAYIETVPGYGYRFVAVIERHESGPVRADLDAELSRFDVVSETRRDLYSLDRTAIQRALQASDNALRRAPDFAPAHTRNALARALHFEGSAADAQRDTTSLAVGVERAKEACELVPDSAEARSVLSYVLHLSGDTSQAAAAGYRALDLDPENPLHLLLTGYVNWGEERLWAARRLLERCPGLALGYWLKTTVHIGRGALKLALEDAERGCAAQDAQTPGVGLPAVGLHLLRGLILAAMNKLEAAEAAFRRELEFTQSDHLFARECAANTWYAVGAVLLRMGREEGAEAAFAQALTIAPGHVSAAAALRGEIPSDPQAGSAPRHGDVHRRKMDVALARAIVLTRAGRHAEAARIYRDMLAEAPAGSTGWLLPVEPLLAPLTRGSIWRDVLALVHARAL